MGILVPVSVAMLAALCACGDALLPLVHGEKSNMRSDGPVRCANDTDCAAEESCVHSRCLACLPDTPQCAGDLMLVSCDATGHWTDPEKPCATGCHDGACRTPNSCSVEQYCGADPDGISCCTSDVVPSGEFEMPYRSLTLRGEIVTGAAARTVSAFALDRFEVSVARFRRFVASYGPDSHPAQGAGALDGLPETGWNAAWNENYAWVPRTQSGLVQMLENQEQYLDTLPEEQLPIRGVNWFVALAFCIWDDARLPTEAEWAYAAQGGSLGRSYPWEGSETPEEIAARASFGMPGGAPHAVGTKPGGAGEYGQQDLAGNLQEWTLDAYADRPNEARCSASSDATRESDGVCVALEPATLRVLRGGSYADEAANLRNGTRTSRRPQEGSKAVGFRCARSLDIRK